MKKRSTLRNVAFALALGSAAAMVAGHVAMRTESVIGSASPQADEVKYSTVRVEAEDADALYDTYHYDSAISAGDLGNGESGRGLNSCWDTNFAVYENVDFIDGAVEVTVRKNVPRASAIEMWIDPVVNASDKSFSGGTKIVDMEFRTSSMSWTTWENFTADVEGLPQGVHRLVVMFKTAAGTNHNQNLAAVNWFEFKVINNRVDLEALEAVEKNVSVNIFSKKKLSVEYVPENALQRDVVWSVVSSDSDGVVEVSADGEVSGLNFGEAVVRATSVWNSAIYVDFNVSVVKPESEKIVIEAEEPVETYECKNVSDMSAEGSEASGGKGLGSDKAYLDSYMKYEFYVPEAGTYDLSVWYVTMNTRWISLQINDQIKTFMACDILTGNWNGVPSETAPGVASKSVKVYCEEGKNTLTVGAVYGYSPEEEREQPYTPNIDRYELVRSDVEIEKPRDWTAADRVEREIEDYDDKQGNASVSNRVAFGTGKGVVLAANGVLSYDIEVPEDGVYCMNIGYATGNCRWVKVMVNEMDTHYVGFTDFNGWGENTSEKVYHHHVLVYLYKGKNLIEIGQYKKEGGKNPSGSDNSPALDRFTLDLVSYPDYQAPERVINFYGNALSDVAKWSSTFGDNLFCDHNEYTMSVSDSKTATVTAEFPWPVLISGYAIATRNNIADWKIEISADGTSWKEIGAESTSKIGVIRTMIADKPYVDAAGNASKFVRLTISGDEPASLGDFCLWGNPYVSAECHIPSGVLAQGFTSFETTHMGFDNASWHEGIDKMFNGICTDRFTVAADGDGSMGDYDDITIDMTLDNAEVVKSYLMSTHYTTMYERNPTAWELYRGMASTESEISDYSDEAAWTLIDSRSDMNFVVPASTLPLDVDNETPSEKYRLVIKSRRGKATHLAGFQMFAASDPTGIEGVDANGDMLMVSGGDGVIRILAPAGEAYAVYTSSGSMVAAGEGSADTVTVSVPGGIYIVAAGAKTAKVLVK